MGSYTVEKRYYLVPTVDYEIIYISSGRIKFRSREALSVMKCIGMKKLSLISDLNLPPF